MSDILLAAAALAVGLFGGALLARRLHAAFGRGARRHASVDDRPMAASHLVRALERQIEEHQRYGSEFSLIYLEFEESDSEVVARVGYTLRTCTRLVDEVGYAANRVVVVLPHIGPSDCAAAAKRLSQEISAAASGDGYTMATASYPRDKADIEQLLERLGRV